MRLPYLPPRAGLAACVCALIGGGITLVGPSAARAQTAYRVGAPPTWVKPLTVEPAAPEPPGRRVTQGYEMLLLDRQEAVGVGGVERFRHVAYRLLDEDAVQDHSQIELSFDPTYEQLTLHGVTVTRNGRSMNQLKTDRIRVARREREMDYQVFEGTLSVVVVLEDVKPGDVVEYSYTRSGSNPVFAGHYWGTVSLEEAVPVRRLQFRLLWPPERSLFVGRHATTATPVVTPAGRFQQYVWAARDVAPKLLDADVPDWYDPFAEIQLSDFDSWKSVAAWGETLFVSHDPMPAVLGARLARIRATYASQGAQALAALRFAQDEVRYLGVEIGVNSHQPYSPATVLRRGYGDCKDKVLLLVTMLRALGMQARPALVSTEYGGHIRDFQPTAAVFDHAIVQAEIDGREHWLDPTVLHQRGDLGSITAPFGAALVLGAGADSVFDIPALPSSEPLTDVHVSFDLPAVGEPAHMRVETRYRGRTADRMRSSVTTTSLDELRRRYTDFYAAAYPAIRSEAAPEITDDEAVNEIRTTERYAIPKFWHPAANDNGNVGTFDPIELDDVIPSTTGSSRTMPLAVTHPVHVRYAIAAHLQEGWNIAPRTDSIETPAIRFVRSVRVVGDSLLLRYEYETRADHVLPAAAPDHLEKMSRVRRLLTFSVVPPQDRSSATSWSNAEELNWPVLVTAAFALGLAVLGVVRVHRAQPPAWPRGPGGGADGPSGLGGWLILVGFGVSVTPLSILVGLVKTGSTYTASSWSRLTTPGTSAYHPLWAPVLLLELVYNIAFLVFACFQAWLFFRRSRWFPALFVILAGARVTFDWLDVLLATQIPATRARGVKWEEHIRLLLVLTIWVAYMFRSRRVQKTFIQLSRAQTGGSLVTLGSTGTPRE